MPGRLIQEIRRVGTRNPVIMLDEVDKIGADFRGDPASALLEVLDPRQNDTFVDRYLDVPFDLSQVIFIATANTIHLVPAPLRDRMEVIDIPGYTTEEKLQIGKRYLVKRQLAENGLKPRHARWSQAAPQDHRGLHPRSRRAQSRARDRLRLPRPSPRGSPSIPPSVSRSLPTSSRKSSVLLVSRAKRRCSRAVPASSMDSPTRPSAARC
jgi:hypothetical protein